MYNRCLASKSTISQSTLAKTDTVRFGTNWERRLAYKVLRYRAYKLIQLIKSLDNSKMTETR